MNVFADVAADMCAQAVSNQSDVPVFE